jgi:hypothetical protein
MTPAGTATARRAPVRPHPRPAPSAPRRPPLRLFEPAPRRRPGTRAVRRSTMWLSGLLIVGSLLAVVVGDAFVTQGQVRLSTTQRALVAAEGVQKTLQVAVAGKAAPPVVVSQAKSQGLVAATQVVYLPQVPLDVPLPPPQIVPTSVPASPSSSLPPANDTPPATTPANSPAPSSPSSSPPSTSASTSPTTTPATSTSVPSASTAAQR